MSPINPTAEQVVIERLQKIGPCHLDDLILSLRELNWDTIVATVDHLLKKRLVLHRDGHYEFNHNEEIPDQAA